MCELFGVSSARCVIINNYLEKFYSHCNQHPHGWGLAIMQSNQSIIDKQPVKASDSDYLKTLLSQPIIVEHAFAHIRLATMGVTDSFNCHPFTQIDDNGRTWTLVHNGTIFKYEALNKYIPTQIGETDSERILLYIVEQINNIEKLRKSPLDQTQMFNVIQSIIEDLAKSNKLNIMIFNGEILYVHVNCRKSLYVLDNDDTLYFSTQPLSDEKWEEVEINTLYGIKNGKILFKGNKHDNEYKITEEHIEYLLNNLSPSQRQTIINEYGGLENVKKQIYNNQR